MGEWWVCKELPIVIQQRRGLLQRQQAPLVKPEES